MTTPGPVANAASPPPKTAVGSRQGGGGKGEASADGEGFGEVLSGLEKTDRGSGKSSSAKSGTRSSGDPGVQPQAADPAARSDTAVADALALLQDDLQLVADAQPDANASPPAATSGATATDGAQASMAALAALNAVGQGASAAQNTIGTAADEAAQPADGKVDDTLRGDAAKRPVPTAVMKGDAAAETTGVEKNPAGPADPNIARVAPTTTGPKEKPAQSKKTDLADAAALAAGLESGESINIVRHTRANVMRQEVHFAPVAEPVLVVDTAEQSTSLVDGPQLDLGELGSGGMRPAQQVAQRIATEAASTPAFARHLAGADQPVGKPALKILQIQLQPADLGTVTVRMEMKDADLVLHVEADRAATAEMIRSDQDSLSKLLRASGYNVDTGSIRVVEGDRGAAAQQNNQQGGGQPSLQSQAQSHSGASHRDDGAQQRGNGQTGGSDAQPARRNESHGTTTQRTGSGLYL